MSHLGFLALHVSSGEDCLFTLETEVYLINNTIKCDAIDAPTLYIDLRCMLITLFDPKNEYRNDVMPTSILFMAIELHCWKYPPRFIKVLYQSIFIHLTIVN